MLPREFTEEQNMFRDAYRKFLAAEIVPHMEDWREAGIVDRSAFEKAGAQGLLMVWPDENTAVSATMIFALSRSSSKKLDMPVPVTGITPCTAAWSDPTGLVSAMKSSVLGSCPVVSVASAYWRLP
jgi:hypothetical protein